MKSSGRLHSHGLLARWVMPKRIAIFGGSFNPPGSHHAAIATRLGQVFDEVRVIPCGPRPDKPVTDSVPPVYRAALADIVFGGLPNVVVDLSDFEQETFTRNHELQTRFETQGEVWHVVGGDLVAGGARGESQIQKTWQRGEELWQRACFAVLQRPGFTVEAADLPPHAEVIELVVEGSSTLIREHLSRGKCVGGLVPPRAEAYLARYGLYRAPVPGNWARGTLEDAKFFLQADASNPKVSELSCSLDGRHVAAEHADFISVVGGDGAMLRSIREHWRARRPFFGINAGHLGFLLNAPEQVNANAFPPSDVIFRQMPMLFLEFEDEQGQRLTAHGFNDAWLERATSQSAWLEVTVNDVLRIPKLVSDGALVATAAGSTAYARSMGAAPLLADTPAWLLVGSNVLEPAHWRSALLSPDTTVTIRSLDPKRRPLQAYVDGLSMGRVVALHARLSRAAAAELVFCASHDMAEKIAAIQFGA
ncbi:NAD(+)/NADH kinase [Prosthecobacter sp.]|uniref:NAD(+)/NADH kinase n=1 Tax=Prosthecobacter sp. TaxID=1965333 RepID=UPI001DFDE9D2|nr:NAD(+)/NADH kinase [Prosthecobacter sp.]MCB1276396.1 NAD(+)/NADH kinase [Prosthecobacter sp.]